LNIYILIHPTSQSSGKCGYLQIFLILVIFTWKYFVIRNVFVFQMMTSLAWLSPDFTPLSDPSYLLHNKVYSCLYCPYTSGRQDHLKIHIRKHTGEKPYFCKFCPYRSSQKSHLNVHNARMHSQTGDTRCDLPI